MNDANSRQFAVNIMQTALDLMKRIPDIQYNYMGSILFFDGPNVLEESTEWVDLNDLEVSKVNAEGLLEGIKEAMNVEGTIN